MRRLIKKSVVFWLLFIPLLGLAQEIDSPVPTLKGQMALEDLRIFVRVFEQVRLAYVEELDDSELFEMAIWGMLSELDPHSEFMNLERIGNLEDATEGQFSGVGIELTMEGSFLTVITAIDGSPAAKAGIKSGDIILRVNGLSIEGFTFRQALRTLEGKLGESLKLTIDRQNERKLLDVDLIRERVAVASVDARVVAEDVGYLRISQFQQNTAAEFEAKLRELIGNNPQLAGLVVDLRNNPGGLLRSAVAVVDLLLDSGLIVSTRGRLESSNQMFYAQAGSIGSELPVVVLINRGSASAAEIVAGALQDHHRAVILGDISFGKGSVQEVLKIDENRAIKLTIARYFTPSGRSIQAQGIYPDIRVDEGEVNWNQPADLIGEANLSGHLNNDNLPGGPELIGFRETLSDIHDVQLAHAVSLLQGSHLINRQLQ